MVIPKKSLSQNFLVDKNISKKIVDQTKVKGNHVLEIGPGYGALTNKIIPKCKKIYAVEIDPLLCNKLKEKKYSNLILFNQDILKWTNDFKKQDNIKIIGNLPYYISSPIIYCDT